MSDKIHNEQDFHDEFYEKEADTIFHSACFSLVKKRNILFILDAIDSPETKTVLSLGCGNGDYELLLAPHFKHITAIDISPRAIEIASQRAKEKGIKNVSFLAGDAGKISLSGTKYDAALLLSFLHHMDESLIRKIIGETYSVLNKKGIFISFDPNANRLVNSLQGLVKKTFDKHHSPDERELPPEFLKGQLQKAGFIHPSKHWIDFFYNPLCWVFPGMPFMLAYPLYLLDNLFLKIPLWNKLSSGFAMVAMREK